jgi:hypothetical protein
LWLAFFTTLFLDLGAGFVLLWIAWGAFSSTWDALGVWLSAGGFAVSSGVAIIASFFTLVALLGVMVTF